MNITTAITPQRSARREQCFAIFHQFVRFFCDVFSEERPLENVPCRQSYKDYVPRYYRRLLAPGLGNLVPAHVKWFRRLEPIFSLPAGARILDYGGGYGMDSILLAALGYDVTFYEITPHHIAIAQAMAERYSNRFGALKMRFVNAKNEPLPEGLDAVSLNEVAHHIEPVEMVFKTAARMLKPDGTLFLLEPNFLCAPVQLFFFRVRGFNVVATVKDRETGAEYQVGNEHIRLISDWTAKARSAGFVPGPRSFTIPWGTRTIGPTPSSMRRALENLPVARNLLASHVTMQFRRAQA
jgi:2-polyprenyl-3-methyl-5-hydroxy-6-metoxy-1,4-benzoquinol methylase